MKLAMILAVLLVLTIGCTTTQVPPPGPTTNTTNTVSGIQDLALTAQDIQTLGLTPGGDTQALQVLELTTDNKYCKTETYETSEASPLAQLGTCSYTIDGLDNTSVIVEMKKYANSNDLNGTYQYESSHLRGAKGLLEENTYGDQSKLSVNSPDDYGAEFNPPGVSFYSLYFTKDAYLVHISTKGSKDVKEHVAAMGHLILSKFS